MKADRDGGGSRGRINLAGSTATYNPERGYPELGDSLPCPAPGEDEAYTLRTATVGELLRMVYECPADIQCGPCRRRIGELARRANQQDSATAHQRDMKLEWKARCEAAEARLASLQDAFALVKASAERRGARLAETQDALEAAEMLYERVEMDESVGICLSDRVPSLRLGAALAAIRPNPESEKT